MISVDGMHAIDRVIWAQAHPTSNFAKLADNGIVYPNAFTTTPSDSYPGLPAQVTGASPKTARLFYEYVRTKTIFEIAGQAGLYSAWSDKHPPG